VTCAGCSGSTPAFITDSNCAQLTLTNAATENPLSLTWYYCKDSGDVYGYKTATDNLDPSNTVYGVCTYTPNADPCEEDNPEDSCKQVGGVNPILALLSGGGRGRTLPDQRDGAGATPRLAPCLAHPTTHADPTHVLHRTVAPRASAMLTRPLARWIWTRAHLSTALLARTASATRHPRQVRPRAAWVWLQHTWMAAT
jgi:hypothetical protein